MNSSDDKIRCLLAMLGTDVHSKGIRTLARLLRDEGVEVIYLGEHNTADGVAHAALSEDVDVVGLSFSNAAYMHYTEELIASMREAGLDEVPVMLGGLIHKDDEPELANIGVSAVFGPGSTTDEITAYLEQVTGKRLPARQRDA